MIARVDGRPRCGDQGYWTRQAMKGFALGEVRIIGGKWRGRRLRFPIRPGLRPTPDRVRETLFDWLGSRVQGARCLDLFGGSGALGFEAASRGADRIVMVECDGILARYLGAQTRLLDARNVELVREDATQWLQLPGSSRPAPFDIVFVDPPFASDHWSELCRSLEHGGWLKGEAFVYLEMPSQSGQQFLPGNWVLTRSGRAGQVGYHLVRRCCGSGVSEEG